LIFSSIGIQKKQRSWRKRRLLLLLTMVLPQLITGELNGVLERLQLLLSLLPLLLLSGVPLQVSLSCCVLVIFFLCY
jgi:hypothetical protein